MAIVQLPAHPGPRALGWALVDFGGTQQGALGGSAQRVNRLGNRWSMTFECPAMPPQQARAWESALARGLKNGVSCIIRQVGTPTGSPGAALVRGAAQAGGTLEIDGLAPGYVVRDGQWLSVLTGGRRYLYMAGGTVMAGADTRAAVPLTDLLRLTPADNAPVELGLPVIEGLLSGPPGWTIDAGRIARGFQFTITEAR